MQESIGKFNLGRRKVLPSKLLSTYRLYEPNKSTTKISVEFSKVHSREINFDSITFFICILMFLKVYFK